MEFALILLFVILFITIVLLLHSSRQKFLDFILFCLVGITIDTIPWGWPFLFLLHKYLKTNLKTDIIKERM